MVWFPHSSYQQVQQTPIPSATTNDTITTMDGPKPIFNYVSPIVLHIWKCSMFIGSSLLACTCFWIRKKVNFRPLQSRQTESCCAGFVSWPDAEAWAQVARRACKLGQNNFGDAYFWGFLPMVWFPHSSCQQVQQPSIPSPIAIDMLTTVDGSKPVLN